MQLYTSWKVVFVASFKCVTIGVIHNKLMIILEGKY
jgi:hypothetical protein